jgi:hypothetical protein
MYKYTTYQNVSSERIESAYRIIINHKKSQHSQSYTTMKLYLAAFRSGIKLENGPGDNLYPLDGRTVIIVSELKQFLKVSCCTSNNKKKKDCLYCSKGYDMWTNLPRGFQFLKGDDNKWWYERGRSDREYASVYVDGGSKENKQEAKDEFDLKEGSVLYLRSSIEHRGVDHKWVFNMEFHVVAFAAAAAVGDVSDVTAAPTIAAVQSDLFPSSPASSLLSLDNKKTPTKAEAKSSPSPSSVYSCTPDGGYPIVKRVVVDNNLYSGITSDHLTQAFGLTEEEEKAAYAQQVEEGQAALAGALDGTGFSPVKDLKRKQDNDDDDDGDEDEDEDEDGDGDGDLMRF